MKKWKFEFESFFILNFFYSAHQPHDCHYAITHVLMTGRFKTYLQKKYPIASSIAPVTKLALNKYFIIGLRVRKTEEEPTVS